MRDRLTQQVHLCAMIADLYRRSAFPVIAVIALQVALYSASWNNFFCGDSLFYLSRRTPHWSDVKANFTKADDVDQYRPLTYPVFTFLLYPIGKLNPLRYHLMALAIHVLLSLAVLALLRRLLEDSVAAFAGYAFFALHSAGYFISYDPTFLPDWLFSGFTLGILTCYLKFLKTGRRLYYAWALAFFPLALLSKETAVMIPAALVCMGLFVRAEPGVGEADSAAKAAPNLWQSAVREAVPFGGISICYLVFLWLLKGKLYPEAPSHPFHITWHLDNLALKYKFGLAAFNIDPKAMGDWTDWLYGILAALLLGTVLWLALSRWSSWTARLSLLGWALALIFPVLLLIEVPYYHHLYMPLVPLSAAVGLMISRRPLRSWAITVFFGVNLALTFLTIQRFEEKSWVAHGSRLARNFLTALKRHHPVLEHGSVIHLRKPKDPNSIWYFDRHSLVRLFYDDPTLEMRFEDIGERLPPQDGPPIPNYFVYQLWSDIFDYPPDYWPGQSIELTDSLLIGEVQEDRTQYYPRFDQFSTPTGGRVFEHYLILDGERRRTVVTISGTRIRVPLPAIEPGSRIHVGLASVLPNVGDGFRALLSIEHEGTETLLLERYIHSARNPGDRNWMDYHLDLSPHAGQGRTLVLECRAGPAGLTQGDWLSWSILKINKRATS